jgi:excisionase family DNA binding protein
MRGSASALALAAVADAIGALVRAVAAEEQARHVCSGDGNRLLTVQAACERAGISRSTLYAWMRDGLPTLQVPGIEAGKTHPRIRVSDFDGWVASRCGKQADDAPGLRSLVKARQTRLGAQKRKVVG